MKRRIRMGQYEFPNPEWAIVSQEGEETTRALSTLMLTHLEIVSFHQKILGKFSAQHQHLIIKLHVFTCASMKGLIFCSS